MAFLWDLIQQFQLHGSRKQAKQAERAAKRAQRQTRSLESQVETLGERLDELEHDLAEMHTAMTVLLDRLERRLGEDLDGDRKIGQPPLARPAE